MSNKWRSAHYMVIEMWCNKTRPRPSLLNNVSVQCAHPRLPGNVRAQIWFQMSSKHRSPLKENAVCAREYCFISSLWTDKRVGQDWLDCIFSHTVAMRSTSLTLDKDERAGLCQDMLSSPGRGPSTSRDITYTHES